MDNDVSDAYIAHVLRSKGVPKEWLEDAMQDVKLAIWRSPYTGSVKTVIFSACIDAARQYGSHSRKTQRPFINYIEPHKSNIPDRDYFTQIEDFIDVRDAIAHLSPMQRAALELQLNRERGEATPGPEQVRHYGNLQHARQSLVRWINKDDDISQRDLEIRTKPKSQRRRKQH